MQHLPRTTAEVADIVADAGVRRAGLEIVGGGSLRALGHAVEAKDTLSLAALDAITMYEPDELVITVEAGTPIERIDAALAAAGQRLAFEPPDWRGLYGSQNGGCTVGGIVAANLSGSRRLAAGAVRDHLIGFTAVNGRGEVFKSGGRVVKNVTGYDLSKLMAGSFGTLAVCTSLTFRVVARAEFELTLAVRPPVDAAATALFARALGGPFDVSGAAWLPAGLASSGAGLRSSTGGRGSSTAGQGPSTAGREPSMAGHGEPVALLRLEGLERSVLERADALTDALTDLRSAATGATAGTKFDIDRTDGGASGALWRRLGDAALLAEARDGALWRISVPPTAGAALLDAVPYASGYLDWAGGLVWLAVPDEGDASAAAIRAHVARTGGHATLVRAAAATRERVDVFEPREPALAALEARVKASFDPLDILNPGRMRRRAGARVA
jgi:glycolate oxidase FAD binding subunit